MMYICTLLCICIYNGKPVNVERDIFEGDLSSLYGLKKFGNQPRLDNEYDRFLLEYWLKNCHIWEEKEGRFLHIGRNIFDEESKRSDEV